MHKKAENLFKMGCDPEFDTSLEEDPDSASIFAILRWMIKMGRINIITKVSVLLSHVALPREGHFEAAIDVGQR